MKEFRLLAVRPLNGTADNFKKNLTSQVIYKFYQDFHFVDHTGSEILESNGNLEINKVEVLFPKSASTNIYSSKELNISVSAVVGQNGSGKSSLIDFYNLILYYLACNHFKTMTATNVQLLTDLRFLVHFVKEYYGEIRKFYVIDNEPNIDYSFNSNELNEEDLLTAAQNLITTLDFRYIVALKSFQNAESELKFSNILRRYSMEGSEHYGIIADNNLNKVDLIYKELNRAVSNRIKKQITNYTNEKEFNEKLEDQLNFQIFYQIDKETYLIEKIGKTLNIPGNKMFYTILLNYSLHSMNSNNLGDWIYKLFHKNDGYQTPNVINPYRKEGNIDVNSELALSTDRLVYNIIDQYRISSKAEILNKYKFKKFIFKLKEDRRYSLSELQIDHRDKNEFLNFLSQIPSPYRFEVTQNGILDYCLGYLIKKFRKISSTYMNHFYELDDFTGMDFPTQVDELQKWQSKKAKEFLLSSNSHVTTKFNQTYNFLVNFELLSSKLSFLQSWNVHQEILLDGDELKQWIEFAETHFTLKSKGTHDLILELFPAIFHIDIEFEKEGSPIKLSDLSSGEQQYIFNINTITYHINNLKTVKKIEGTSIKKYDYINIILDEIELYYHPEYQKKLVKDLIDEIKKIDSLGDLKNFNILFLTHSPFILSDIPNQNILRLEEGKPSLKEFEQTFGANIHDILANDFFLNGFMGEFAKGYITDLVESIENIPFETLAEEAYKHYIEKINLIGEPVIKNSVRSLLDKKFEKKLVLTRRRAELEKELLIVTNQLNYDGTN